MGPPYTPRTRRPSRITHRANLEADYRKKTPAMPPDGDTFFYNQAFVSEWDMSRDLWIRLPSKLTSELEAWQAAGAAVMTVLARYDNLEREATSRGWPERINDHLSRTTSYASPTLQAPTSPSMRSAPLNGTSTLPSLLTKLELGTNKDRTMPTILDTLDTPPFTPQNSGLGQQGIDEATTGPIINNESDLDKVNTRLADMTRKTADARASEPSPLTTPSSRRSSGASHTSANCAFDEAAWDIYINACKAELDFLRSETLVRFRHLGRGIDRLWTELKSDSSQHMLKNASVEFTAWWKQMSEKAQECEIEARALELPNLEEVKHERLAEGLTI